MRKRLLRFIAMIVMLAISPAFALDSGSVRVIMPSMTSGSPILPFDRIIGQVVEPDCDETHIILYDALSENYTFEWTESHIAPEVRQALVHLFDQWFSTHLPCEGFLMSVSHVNADGSTGINVRSGDSCMAFVLSEGMIISMKEMVF